MASNPFGWRTQGIETSYYLQEKKATAMPLVVANESGKGQTESLLVTSRTCGVSALLARVGRTPLERGAEDGDSPVDQSK